MSKNLPSIYAQSDQLRRAAAEKLSLPLETSWEKLREVEASDQSATNLCEQLVRTRPDDPLSDFRRVLDAAGCRARLVQLLALPPDTGWGDITPRIRDMIVELGLPGDANLNEIQSGFRLRERARRSGLPDRASEEQILQAEDETERRFHADRLNLPPDATWPTIEAEHQRQAAISLGLPPDATVEQINEIHWLREEIKTYGLPHDSTVEELRWAKNIQEYVRDIYTWGRDFVEVLQLLSGRSYNLLFSLASYILARRQYAVSHGLHQSATMDSIHETEGKCPWGKEHYWNNLLLIKIIKPIFERAETERAARDAARE